MKKYLITITACLLMLLMTMLSPLQAIAAAGPGTGKYISEVKIGMGKDAAAAAAALKGYTILSDKSGNIDLNQKAGGGWGSKGEKVVYLGYKTTNDSAEAITDLSVMNMKGGYSVPDYEALFDSYIATQIYPLLDDLIAAIKEYRLNFVSENESNRQRAVYIHDILNKFIDDDTGKGLGNLLLNPTKYELGDEAYNKLSEAQKSNTADIVTIFAQSNGNITLMLENLLARAADTSDDTWFDRFAATTYDDLIDEVCDEQGLLPTDAETELDRLYQDSARKVFAQWNDFESALAGYNDDLELIENYDADAAASRSEELSAVIESFKEGKATFDEMMKATEELLDIQNQMIEVMNAVKLVSIYEYLKDVEYGDGTLLDFFSRRAYTFPISELYPLVASFSDGQKAGLDFISLSELIVIALTDGKDYSDSQLDELKEVSIYDQVDRGIYEKCSVALTSAAKREEALKIAADVDEFKVSQATVYVMATGAAAFLAFAASSSGWAYYGIKLSSLNKELDKIGSKISDFNSISVENEGLTAAQEADFNKVMNQKCATNAKIVTTESTNTFYQYATIGLSVVLVILIGLSVYMTYTDLVDYYDVEFTPIPHYMVDEKDITAYNEKGEKIFIKNQTAYYKAVECNRTSADERFGTLGTCSDLNGDVGKQWLALYAVKNEAMAPILADSLMAVVGDDRLPANYTTGIHMFGSDTAFDLNNHMYVWNGEAPSVYVYFNTDSAAKRSAIGSVFADSVSTLAGGIGIIIGALAAFTVISLGRKKKEDETSATV